MRAYPPYTPECPPMRYLCKDSARSADAISFPGRPLLIKHTIERLLINRRALGNNEEMAAPPNAVVPIK